MFEMPHTLKGMKGSLMIHQGVEQVVEQMKQNA